MRDPLFASSLARLAQEFKRSDASVLAVLQVGSQAVDLDTPTSDADLLAIVSRDVFEHDFVDVDDVVVDITVIGEQRLDAMWDRVTGRWDSENYAALYEERSALSLLGRVHTGRVLKGDDVVAAVRERMPAARLSRALQIHFAIRAATFARDAVGGLLGEDLETADDTSAASAKLVAQMMLAASGDLYFGDKFTRRRLERNEALAPIAGVIREAIQPNLTPSHESVEHRLQITAALSAFVSLYAPDGDLDRESSSDFGRRLAAAQSVSWHASGSVIVPLDDGLYIAGTHNVVMDAPHVVAWFSRLIDSGDFPAELTASEMAGIDPAERLELVRAVDDEQESYESVSIDEEQLGLVAERVDGSGSRL